MTRVPAVQQKLYRPRGRGIHQFARQSSGRPAAKGPCARSGHKTRRGIEGFLTAPQIHRTSADSRKASHCVRPTFGAIHRSFGIRMAHADRGQSLGHWAGQRRKGAARAGRTGRNASTAAHRRTRSLGQGPRRFMNARILAASAVQSRRHCAVRMFPPNARGAHARFAASRAPNWRWFCPWPKQALALRDSRAGRSAQRRPRHTAVSVLSHSYCLLLSAAPKGVARLFHSVAKAICGLARCQRSQARPFVSRASARSIRPLSCRSSHGSQCL